MPHKIIKAKKSADQSKSSKQEHRTRISGGMQRKKNMYTTVSILMNPKN